MKFEKVELQNPAGVAALSALATDIVREHFDPLIGKAQNDYMISRFQTVEAITNQLEHGYQYYFVCENEQPVGFLAFYPPIYAYEHLGFVKIREEKNDIGQGFFMDDFVLSYKIE